MSGGTGVGRFVSSAVVTITSLASSAGRSSVARRYAVLRPHLDERQRRLVLAAEAAELGRGGIAAVAAATG